MELDGISSESKIKRIVQMSLSRENNVNPKIALLLNNKSDSSVLILNLQCDYNSKKGNLQGSK